MGFDPKIEQALDVQPGSHNKLNLNKLNIVFVVFALVYFSTALYFGQETNYQSKNITADNIFGPIKTTKKNEVIEIEIKDRSVNEGWSFVSVDFVKEDKKTVLLSWGGENWHETGYDSEGHWSESDRNKDIRLTVPKPGTYYLKFQVEGGGKHTYKTEDRTAKTHLNVRVSNLVGTTTIYNSIGVLLLIFAVVSNEIKNRTIIGLLTK